MEAGFRVIPLLTNMWTMKYDESLDETLCQEWKKTVALDDDIVREIQACRIFETSPNLALTDREVKLLEKHVDIFYVTIWPNIAGHLCHQFNSIGLTPGVKYFSFYVLVSEKTCAILKFSCGVYHFIIALYRKIYNSTTILEPSQTNLIGNLRLDIRITELPYI